MDIKFNLPVFELALKALIPITRNGSAPVHNCIYLETVQAESGESYAKMIASNLLISITLYVPLTDMTESGAFLIYFDTLFESVKRAKGNALRIYWHEKDRTLQYTMGRMRGRLSIMDVSSFTSPTEPQWEDVQVSLANLYDALSKVNFAMAPKNSGSPNLEAIEVAFDKNSMQLTAGDRIQIAVARTKARMLHQDDIPKLTISSQNVQALTRTLDLLSRMDWLDADTATLIIPDGEILKQLTLDVGMMTISLTIMAQHTFPNINLSVYENPMPIQISLERDKMIEALDVCAIASRDNANISFLELPEMNQLDDKMLDRMNIYLIAESASTNDAVRIDIPSIPKTSVERTFVGIDSKKLHQALRAFTQKVIVLHRDPNLGAIVLKPDDENLFDDEDLHHELSTHFLVMSLVHANRLLSEAGIY